MTNITPDILYKLAPPLIALQFAAFGWRVNREIGLTGDRRHSVIPIPDVLNIVSLFATIIGLIVLPMTTDNYAWLSRMVLGGAYVLIAFHPFTTAAHYRLWSRQGTLKYVTDGNTYPYATGEEVASASFSLALAISVATYIGTH